MEEYRLIDVKSRNKYANSWGNSEPYVATYEVKVTRKKYFLFGKLVSRTYNEDAVFDVPNHTRLHWLDEMEKKKGVWRKRN